MYIRLRFFYVQNASITFKSVNKCIKSLSKNDYILFDSNTNEFKNII